MLFRAIVFEKTKASTKEFLNFSFWILDDSVLSLNILDETWLQALGRELGSKNTLSTSPGNEDRGIANSDEFRLLAKITGSERRLKSV